jgi:NAD(P)-dependent dehydrogenase (short-subunit alcohol dehydrogenase family)
MSTLILTGASKGIGRALARALPPEIELHAVARDRAALEALGRGRAWAVDLSTTSEAERLGRALAEVIPGGTTLVHNAGLWPSRRELVDGYERAFAVNVRGPLALQAPLVASGKVSRVLVIGAGLMIKGRFDPDRTPTGADFHWMRTYASTKLAFAVATREIARRHPTIDFAVIHPGVVATELGARPGVVGWLLSRIKTSWESPEDCAARLVRVLGRDRWSSPGEARWLVLEEEAPWPAIADESAAAVARALRDRVQ